MAQADQFGRDIKVSSGNVIGRLLPIRIHDLDGDDLMLLEKELGGALRSIEFIYKEPGVNRPLTVDDNEVKNLNGTKYRNQVNKVANAIKEIIGRLKNPSATVHATLRGNSPVFHESESQPIDSIAVLPFANMSSDPEQEYFSDGISEEIINTLVQLPSLKVVGRTSSFTFKGKNEDLRTIGEKLGVRTVLEGSVRSSGNRIRITAQLIDVQNGFHLWSEKYDRVLNDVFEVQDEIAKVIVEKLQITLAGKLVEPKPREQTQSVEAYQHYLKGRALTFRRGKHMFDALPHFQKALEIDPEYALAYAGLADAYTVICFYGLLEPKENWSKAIECARKAMQLGPDLAETHNCNAAILMLHDWDWVKSKQEYLKALELNPGYEQALVWYGLFYLQMAFGNHDEAIRTIRLAVEVNPLSFYSNTILGVSLGIAGQLEEGLEKTKRGVEIEPDAYLTQLFSGIQYYMSGHYDEAERAFEKALALSNRHSWALSMMVPFYLDWSKKEKAVELYEELLTRSRKQYIQPATLAVAAAALGHNDEALKFAHQACHDHDPFLIFNCKSFPTSKALRAIPAFSEVLKRMGLL